MPTRECPICRKTIRAENVEKHYENVHPGKAVPVELLRAQEDTVRDAREARRASAPSRRPRGRPTAAIAVLVLVAAGIVGGAVYLSVAPASANVVTYCGGEGTAQHYHALLVINVNGAAQDVPANIGITMAPGYTNPAHYCPAPALHALHTHDGSGIIHLELPGSITSTPSLGDFFETWGAPLFPTQVWTFSGSVRATLYRAGPGTSTDYSSAPKSIPLSAPAGGADVYPIPSQWIHNGQFGNGDSNGVFSGEIVFLNVTR